MIPFIDDGNCLVGGSSTNKCKIKSFYGWQALPNAEKKIETIPGLGSIRVNTQVENERNRSYALS